MDRLLLLINQKYSGMTGEQQFFTPSIYLAGLQWSGARLAVPRGGTGGSPPTWDQDVGGLPVLSPPR